MKWKNLSDWNAKLRTIWLFISHWNWKNDITLHTPSFEQQKSSTSSQKWGKTVDRIFLLFNYIYLVYNNV